MDFITSILIVILMAAALGNALSAFGIMIGFFPALSIMLLFIFAVHIIKHI